MNPDFSQDTFSPEKFTSVTLENASLLRSILENSNEESCEFSFTNLYCWQEYCETKFQIWKKKLILWFSKADLLMVTCRKKDEEEAFSGTDLHIIALAMKKAGKSGKFYQIRKAVLEKDPDFARFFHIKPAEEEISEYIYKTEKLALLPGNTLGKKRNLIHQFKREHPQVKLSLLTEENWHKARIFAEKWYASYPGNPEELAGEKSSLNYMQECFIYTELTGLLAEENGEVLAFATSAPITEKIWTEPLEKALPQYKGAAQFINNELAKMLLEKENCIFLNREQDLGLAGLRQAKLSYLPENLLQNFVLIPKE